MKKISITAQGKSWSADLNESQTALAIWEALPIKAKVKTWGYEIYFEIPVGFEVENKYARETVQLGDLAFWSEGSCFCIFFGPTPISQEGEIRPASTVNFIGRVSSDLEGFKKIKDNTVIDIERE